MLIRITKSPYSHGTTLEVNGQSANIPPEGETADIAEDLLPALGDSHILYEIVGAADEAGEALGGSSGDSPAELPNEESDKTLPEEEPDFAEIEEPADVDLAILDDSVPNIILKFPGMSPADMRVLLASENAGKTRKTLISALEEALNPPQE